MSDEINNTNENENKNVAENTQNDDIKSEEIKTEPEHTSVPYTGQYNNSGSNTYWTADGQYRS